MIVFPSSYLTATAGHQGTNYTYCALPEESQDEVYTCEARPQSVGSWLPTYSGNADWWTAPKRQKKKTEKIYGGEGKVYKQLDMICRLV